jgi:hypothetical protein
MGIIKDELPEHRFHHPNDPVRHVFSRAHTQEEGHDQEYLRVDMPLTRLGLQFYSVCFCFVCWSLEDQLSCANKQEAQHGR